MRVEARRRRAKMSDSDEDGSGDEDGFPLLLLEKKMSRAIS